MIDLQRIADNVATRQQHKQADIDTASEAAKKIVSESMDFIFRSTVEKIGMAIESKLSGAIEKFVHLKDEYIVIDVLYVREDGAKSFIFDRLAGLKHQLGNEFCRLNAPSLSVEIKNIAPLLNGRSFEVFDKPFSCSSDEIEENGNHELVSFLESKYGSYFSHFGYVIDCTGQKN